MDNDVWSGEDKIRYVPSRDGTFECWMDENDPTWEHSNSTEIEFLRRLWDAARSSAPKGQEGMTKACVLIENGGHDGGGKFRGVFSSVELAEAVTPELDLFPGEWRRLNDATRVYRGAEFNQAEIRLVPVDELIS